MTTRDRHLPRPTGDAELDRFLGRMAAAPSPGAGRGRLLMTLDATMSRQPTWDLACRNQARMFEAVAGIGSLDVQMAWFRGHGEFHATEWSSSAVRLARQVTGVACRGGRTQIRRVLDHALAETRRTRIHALVYVGDSMEENADDLCARAGELALCGVPAFLFQEGPDPLAHATFAEIARLTGGAHLSFDTASADRLADLLRAVAVFAVGGRVALQHHGQREGGAALLLARQVR